MIVLIDNDQLVGMSWEFAAKKANIDFSYFKDVESFLSQTQQFNKEITIYIDSELDNGLLGEIEAKKIFEAGFTKLYLASGKSFKDSDLPDYILGSVSKRAPF